MPWKKIPNAASSRETGHGRIDTRTLKAVHVDRLGIDFPHIHQARYYSCGSRNLR